MFFAIFTWVFPNSYSRLYHTLYLLENKVVSLVVRGLVVGRGKYYSVVVILKRKTLGTKVLNTLRV